MTHCNKIQTIIVYSYHQKMDQGFFDLPLNLNEGLLV
jgi:hypothetical protein